MAMNRLVANRLVPAVACVAVGLVVLPLRPVAAGPEHKCPDGAKWRVVADNRPLKECGDRPLEQGCMLANGRKHGTWIVYETRLHCTARATHSTYKLGRKHGHEWVWRVVCAGKGKAETCRSLLSEQGEYREDKRRGTWFEYHDNGKPSAEGNYFAGTKQGPWTLYSPAGKATTVRCMQDGKLTWEAEAAAVQGTARPCAVTREARTGDGTRAVSANETRASKLVALAQKATKKRLKLLYLEKAVQLAPDNNRYARLLEAARAGLAGSTKTKPRTRPAP